jgi:hypothetical protein
MDARVAEVLVVGARVLECVMNQKMDVDIKKNKNRKKET